MVVRNPPLCAAVALAAAFALAACDQRDTTTENSVEALEEAAEQSTPRAAEVLENAAERIEDQNVQLPPGAPGSPVQEAMERAGDAQTVEPPPMINAKPHREGDPVPPPPAP